MGYTFQCDVCTEPHDSAPPLMAQFNETFLKRTDSPLAQVFDLDQTVTVCRGCAEELLL